MCPLLYTNTKAPTEELALAQLDKLKETFGNSYGMVINSWYNNWNNLSTFFDFSPRIYIIDSVKFAKVFKLETVDNFV